MIAGVGLTAVLLWPDPTSRPHPERVELDESALPVRSFTPPPAAIDSGALASPPRRAAEATYRARVDRPRDIVDAENSWSHAFGDTGGRAGDPTWLRNWLASGTEYRSVSTRSPLAGVGSPGMKPPTESAATPAPQGEAGPPRRVGALVGIVKRVDGTPIGGAIVVAAPESSPGTSVDADSDARRRTGATTSDGRFELSVEEGVPYVLSTEVPEYPLAVLHGANVGLDVEVLVVRYTSALIRVRDAEGRAVAQAHVEAAPVERRGVVVHCTDSSDAGGLAELRGLVEGARYRLVVAAPSGRTDLVDERIEDWTISSDCVVELGVRR